MNKTRVYIVFQEFAGPEQIQPSFVGVFFDRKSAEEWIWQRKNSKEYYIETYEQPEAGMTHEVFA